MRLVDTNMPFKVVYAISHHEYLGYLISAHAVQVLASGELSLVHQVIHPENIDEFREKIDENDRQLVKMTREISVREVVKRFGGNPRDLHTFFTQKFDGEIKKLAHLFIQRRLGKMLPLIQQKELYVTAKDGYPAQKRIDILKDRASILFHFRKKEDFTRYYPTIKLRDEKVDFQRKGAILLCLDPAWMLLNGELFTFEKPIDGKKLKPFLSKEFISIPKSKEEEYYRKFITQIIEQYPVYAKGFNIETVRENPSFSLLVKEHDHNSYSFIRQVHYGHFCFPIEEKGTARAELKKEGDNYTFFRIFRKCSVERELLDYYDKIQPNQNSLTPWTYIEKKKGLAWLADYSHKLEEMGVSILQEEDASPINLVRPEIEMETTENGDWFDIKAVVKIGKFSIPFIKFRSHILKNNREYKLPDGSIAILPEHWFSDYRHLLEISENQVNGEETISIRKYQAPLLNFPSEKNNGKTSFMDAVKNLENIPVVQPPEELNAMLRNYQEAGFNWLYFMKSHSMGGILADDMGLGKTLQTLALLQKEKENGITTPSLVVLPTSLIPNWNNEAAKFTPSLQIYTHTGIGRTKEVADFSRYDLVLTTYGIVRQDIDILKSFPFHYVILDESQMIKNPDSKTAKAVRKLVSRHKLSLTGTPIENTVMDIWSQMAFLNPGLLGSETFFKKFYVGPIEKNRDAKRSAKLRRIIYPFILRRKKQQVEKELPPRIEKLHYCEMVPNQEKFYEETRNAYRNYLMELFSQGTWKRNKLNILTGLQKLRQIAIHPQMIEPEEYKLEESGKYQEVKRLLKQVIGKNRSKVLIFSQFVKMLHLIRDDLDKEGIKYNYLDGSTKDRQTPVDTFQNDKNIRVFLISLKAGGVGLNLTAADYVFILDPWWNPAVENQAIDRSHRIGQTRTVFYYKFITKDSIEEKILNLQRRKAEISDDIIQVEEEVYKSLSEMDLEDLLN